jgi:formiminoglutamase
VPVVLGGGHETAYGHYLGYALSRVRGSAQAASPPGWRPVAVINLDAHLDVRPFTDGHGHSGTPFRQAMEHPDFPLPGERYVCLGAEPHACAREHVRYVREHGGAIRWADEVRGRLADEFVAQRDRLAAAGCQLYVTLDADAVGGAEVAGVSAPGALGLSAVEVARCAYLAGLSSQVSSFDLVEVNPREDPTGQSVRWAAGVVWQFLAGLARRRSDRGVSGN